MRVYQPAAVLFLHAFPLNKNMYKYQFEAFEKEGIPYIAVDYPGFGEERNFPTDYSISQLTDIIVSKINQLGIKKIIPIGDSMGGYIMFDLWRRYKDLISALVFVATRAEADTEEAKKARYITIEKIKKEGKDFLIEFMIDAQTSPKTKEDTKKIEELLCIMNEATEEGIIKALKALAERPDNTELLKTINVPTLVIAGKDDEKVTPPSVVKQIADGIENSLFIEIPDSAHLPPFENPEEFNKVVIPFIKENL
ncbi:MAG: alpha/beta hydrolase [Aquificae bacterium]|nr:alpha/beta hydrolase [Aquificota bacterium]